MDNRHLHHLWTRIRPVKTWYLLLAFVVCGTVCVFALRQNNLHMISLRNQVYQADKDNGDVEAALRQLRSYVYAHMNTNLSAGADAVYPPIQLKYTYQRLAEAAQTQTEAANSQIYTDAQHYCEQLYPGSFSGGPRVPCIQSYVTSHGVKASTVPDSLYKFAFASPAWSPDLAGWSLAATAILGLAAALRLALGWWLKKRTA